MKLLLLLLPLGYGILELWLHATRPNPSTESSPLPARRPAPEAGREGTVYGEPGLPGYRHPPSKQRLLTDVQALAARMSAAPAPMHGVQRTRLRYRFKLLAALRDGRPERWMEYEGD
ncbi:hypothetical protein [Thioalbus denitrificans]|uniref:Uncharacterized protein n=1 Tax=Thioalbus denitrificans TaxID=547122 RepID=A0A369CI20_9GAMM|nr:hypothetical protein [Thioalbus denitrificans]RCX33579.1 hypothetical protein DFQ59_101885 [Thioalbus denitrificans]